MRHSIFLVTLALSLVAPAALASSPPDPAEAKLAAAEARLAEANFEGALAELEAARAVAVDEKVRARVLERMGIVQLVLGKRLPALLSFIGAVRSHPGAALDPSEHDQSVLRLFDCARQLAPLALDEAALARDHGEALAREDWTCPAPPPPPPAGDVALVAPAEPAMGTSGAPSWPIWLAGGVALAAGAAGTYFGLDAVAKVEERGTATDPAIYQAAGTAAEDRALGATISWGVSAAAGAAAIGLLTWYLLDDPTPADGIAFSVGAGSVAASF